MIALLLVPLALVLLTAAWTLLADCALEPGE